MTALTIHNAKDASMRLLIDPEDAMLMAQHPPVGVLLGLTSVNTYDTGARASEMLGGACDDKARLRIARTIEGHALPPGFDHIMRHMGVDPDFALALSLVSPTRRLAIFREAPYSDEPDRIANIGLFIQDMTWIGLGDRVSWRKDCILAPALPETALLGIVGQSIERLLTHPALEGLDLTIVETHECWEDGTALEYVTSLHAAG